MPVPVFGPDRPSGQVEPEPDLTGLTELRVHGVGGTTPGDLLADLRPQQVAGDRLAGFYRTTDVTAGGVRRHVEAYSWGGLTSRSGTRVLWLLLLPFLLANLAGWMCSPRARRSAVHRWLIRLAALGLTLNGLVLAVLAMVDVLGYQCGTDPACRDRHRWAAPFGWPGIEANPARQVLVGVVPVVAAVVLLAFLSYRSRKRYEAVRPPVVGHPVTPGGRSAAARPGGLADPDFWDGGRATKRLGRAHTAASVGLLTFTVLHGVGLALGPAARYGAASLVLQVLALAAVAGAVALLAVEDGPDRSGAGLLVGSSAVGLLAAVLTALQPSVAAVPDGQLPGLRDVVTATYGGVVAVMALVLGTVLVFGRARGSFRWGAPFVVLALAVAVLNAVLLGLLVLVARLAGSVAWTAGPGPAGSVSVWPVVRTAMPFLTVVPIGLALVFTAVQVARWRWAGSRGLSELAEEYGSLAADPAPDGPLRIWHRSTLDDPVAWRRKVARARRLAALTPDVSVLLSALAVAGTVFILYAEWRLLHEEPPVGESWLLGVSTAIAVALPAVLLAALRWGWRSLAGRRLIGVLWDVGTFWPRSFHPYAPPSYAERAVPDLQRRMWWLHDKGGTVLLAAHSQGSVLAAAALLSQSARAPGSCAGLVTFGSPLGKLYRWAFPAWVDDDVLAGLAGPDTRWVNVHYPTDYIGGPVFGSGTPGVDRRLPDPPTCHYVHGQPPPAVAGHSGYWRDPAMWAIVDAVAADLTR